MSLLKTQTIACPACGTSVDFDVFYSVNADRRPDIRAAAIDGSFQRLTCATCQTAFRVDPDFNYLDMARGQWIAGHPLAALRDWERIETADRGAFDRAYGTEAPEGAKAIGAQLTVRIAFGWPAFREKLVARDCDLDDRELELLKMAILRTVEHAPISDEIELRFTDRSADDLLMTWVNAVTDTAVETLVVPISAYDAIKADTAAWEPLRESLCGVLFVDMQRMIVPAT